MDRERDIAAELVGLAQKAGADAADAVVFASTSVLVGVSGGALEEAERSEQTNLGLRVLIGQRQAVVASSDARPETLATMAERAVTIAREAPEDPWCGLADAAARGKVADLAALDLEDHSAPPGPEALERIALAGEAAALTVAGVTQVEQATASWGGERIALADSTGFAVAFGRTGGSVGVSAIAGSGLGRERDYAGEFRRHWADMPSPEEIGERAANRAVAALNPRKPPAGAYPVVFDHRISGSLIGHILSAINGTAIARGASWLAARMGERILPEGFDILDDPLIPRAAASRPYDGEGIGSRRLALVEDGVLQSWVLDLATARQLDLATTGHAQRGTGGPPSPGTSNIRVTQGAQGRDGLLADMGTGLLVTSMIGSSVNPTTGAYSRGASGFWVENGAIAYPVNEITVAGSLPEMIRTLRPANDADPHRRVSVPSLLVEGLTIGA